MQAGEACDDANLDDGDTCSSACFLSLGQSCTHALQCSSAICSGGVCIPCKADSECAAGRRCMIGMCLTNAQISRIPNVCGNGTLEEGEQCDDGNNAYGDGCTPLCVLGNTLARVEVAANVAIQMPFGTGPGYGSTLHAGAGDGLSDTGPATVAVMAAGAAAGAAWVRRRRKMH